MELNLTTFLLEMVNFLVLVALLRHWFYRPVLEALDRRREAIAADLEAATEAREQAAALATEYEERLRQWDLERVQAREAMQKEIREEKSRSKSDLRKEREKAVQAGMKELETLREQYQLQAMEQGARFVSRLLERLASPDLEAALVTATLEDLQQLDPSVLEALRSNHMVQVSSAHKLSKDQKKKLEELLGPVEWHQDPELLAGLRIEGGSRSLGASLLDELELFQEAGHA